MEKKLEHQKSLDIKPVKALAAFFSIVAFFSVIFTSTAANRTNDPFSQKNAAEASIFNGVKSYNGNDKENKNQIPTEKTQVIPLGKPFGIKLFTDGVIVASLSDLDSDGTFTCPAREAGIQPGDYILAVNGEKIENNDQLARRIGACGGNPIVFKVRRGNKSFEATIMPALAGGAFKTGMWIRDSAAGIGTLTFYNPNVGVFAGLGHGICDLDTNGVMELSHGEPAEINLCGIIRGEKNAPGQLQGYFSSDEPLGELLENNETGIYGTFESAPEGELMQVADRDEVERGEAEILTTLDSNGPQRYKVEIEAINPQNQKTRNLVVKVIDDRLIEKTGGIVQGMSGSPIIQNGKLVGAITHVFTEDPTTGYGIYAATMTEESVVYSMSKKSLL